MLLTNRLGLPQPIVDAVTYDDYDGPGLENRNTFSVTRLLSPPQMIALIAKHEGVLVEDASDRIWALMGKSVHEVLRRADNVGITETRLTTTLVVDGVKYGVSGAFDRLALIEREGRAVLQDYKLASVWEVILETKPERAQQLNILAWIARRCGYRVDEIENVMILRDWSKRKAKTQPDYPQAQVAIVKQPFWADEVTELLVADRIRAHVAALAGTPPECTDDERWARKPQYAVMKGDNKKASKLFDTEADASAWAAQQTKPEQYRVEIRRAEAVRCESYCAVADFCPQRLKELRG